MSSFLTQYILKTVVDKKKTNMDLKGENLRNQNLLVVLVLVAVVKSSLKIYDRKLMSIFKTHFIRKKKLRMNATEIYISSGKVVLQRLGNDITVDFTRIRTWNLLIRSETPYR